MRVLLIDDQPANVATVQAEIQRIYAGSECTIVSFQDAQGDIDKHSPHVVILDLMQGGGAQQEATGLATRDYIWSKRFCPLIVYTAAPEVIPADGTEDHPFMKVVKKGMDSDTLVLKCMQDFEPHIRALDEAQNEVRRTMNDALKVVAPLLFKSSQVEDERREMVVRAARRRVAAQMDEALLTDSEKPPVLKSWECYLFPPVSDQLMMGDLLIKDKSDPNDPKSYAIVLTPSCDLVKTEKRPPKVSRVLIAHCTSCDRVLRDLGINTADWKENKHEKLDPVLSRGYSDSCIPLPGIPGVMPAMAADLRVLDLIPFEQIGTPGASFVRVASIDNPWRELLAWAFMLSSARPGMPDRDCQSWKAEIIAQFPAPAGGKK